MPPTYKKQLVNPLTAAASPLEAERRVIDSILQSKVGMKDTTLIRYSGVKTTVTYLQQIIAEGNDYLVNLNSFNDIDVNMKVFRRIDEFTLAIRGEMTPEEEADPGLGVSMEAGSVATILPRTVKPRMGDAFIMKQYDRIGLYRVSSVTPKTFETDAGFEIEYVLEADNFRMETHPVGKCISETWKFESRHVGTGLRSLFRSEDYAVLKSLRELYNELSEEYVAKFYQKILNTFLLEPKLDLPAPLPYTLVDPPPSMEEEPLPDAVQEARDKVLSYVGKKLFDRELIHFIIKHSIFYTADNVLHPTAFFDSRSEVYRDTIFGAIESRNTKRYHLFYLVPAVLNVATIGYPPQLFGKVDLSWSPSITYGCLDLFPANFAMKIKTSSYEARSGYDASYFSKFGDVLTETISAYIRGLPENDDKIVDRLNFIAVNSENLSSISDKEKFYLYPLIAKIILEMLMRLASEDENTSY